MTWHAANDLISENTDLLDESFTKMIHKSGELWKINVNLLRIAYSSENFKTELIVSLILCQI